MWYNLKEKNKELKGFSKVIDTLNSTWAVYLIVYNRTYQTVVLQDLTGPAISNKPVLMVQDWTFKKNYIINTFILCVTV